MFRLERWGHHIRTGKETREVVHGVTSLTAAEASPQRLLALTRGHWAIENGLHYRRDATLREDRSQVRRGQAPQVLAALNNVVLGRLLRQGVTNVPQARRRYAAHPEEALPLIP